MNKRGIDYKMWNNFLENIIKPKQKVQKYILGKTNIELPSLGMSFSTLPINNDSSINVPKIESNIKTAMDLGINFFEFGWNYHFEQAERTVSQVLMSYPRDSYILATKFPTWLLEQKTKETIFAEQLKKLKTNYIDLYMLHSLTDAAYEKLQKYNVYEYLKQLKANNKIKAIGFSYHGTPEFLEELLTNYEWDFVSIQLNFIEWKFGNAKKLYEIATKYNIPILADDSLRQGDLTKYTEKEISYIKKINKKLTPADIALKFSSSLNNTTSVICQMDSSEQISKNAKSFHTIKPLNKKEQEFVDNFVPLECLTKELPCSGCGKCEGFCDIKIRENFFIANHYTKRKDFWFFIDTYNTLRENEKADKCTKCEKCSGVCPMAIDIPTNLTKVNNLAKANFSKLK